MFKTRSPVESKYTYANTHWKGTNKLKTSFKLSKAPWEWIEKKTIQILSFPKQDNHTQTKCKKKT